MPFSTQAKTSRVPWPALAALIFALATGPDAVAADEDRVARHLALARELADEGAAAEAALVMEYLAAEAAGAGGGAEYRAAAPGAGGSASADAPQEGQDGAACRAAALPARVIVAVYRKIVGPAIGERCVLEPSCSRYFLEACRRHGLLGFPMIADRFVREPPESHSDRLVRRPDGTWRHSDPVSDHDWWF